VFVYATSGCSSTQHRGAYFPGLNSLSSFLPTDENCRAVTLFLGYLNKSFFLQGSKGAVNGATMATQIPQFTHIEF
jgi:hypothetical protein